MSHVEQGDQEFEEGIELPPEVVDEITIPLIKPLKLGDMEYASLTLTEPTAKQLSQAQLAGRKGSEIDVVLSLINQTARVPLSAVQNLCQRDLTKCGSFFARFA